MSLTKSIILKCGQHESVEVIKNGEYKVRLNQPVELQEGDVLNLKSVFLDTVASSSGKINIAEDLPLTISVAKYLQNYDIDQPLKSYFPVRNGTNKVDNQKYFLCSTKTTNPATRRLSNIIVKPHDKKQKYWGHEDKDGHTVLQFTYTNNTGQPNQPFSITLRRQNNHGLYKSAFRQFEDKTTYENAIAGNPMDFTDALGWDVSPIFDATTFQYVGGDEILKKNNIDLNIVINTEPITVGSGAICDLRHLDWTYTLPAGNYEPSELATLITQNLVNINYFDVDIGDDGGAGIYPVASPFLATLDNLKTNLINEWANTAFNFCREDGASIMTFPNTVGANDRFCGANLVSLDFDDNQKKMNFSLLHMPIYLATAGGGGASNGAIFQNNGVATQYSGVCITGLQPSSFWNDTLGFNNERIVSGGDSGNIVNAGGTNTLTSKINFPIKYGKDGSIDKVETFRTKNGFNTTGALASIDMPIRKDATTFNQVGGSNVPTLTSFTTPIYFDKVFNDPSKKTPYFMVEVSATGLQQDLRGSDISGMSSSNKISGIISRYYENNNYTSDMGSGNILYEHKGATQTISEINIRILDDGGNVPASSDLGERNSVFLEIVKNVSRQMPRKDQLDYSQF